MSVSYRRLVFLVSVLALPLLTFDVNATAQPDFFSGSDEIRGRVSNLRAGSSMQVVLREGEHGRFFDQAQVSGDGVFRLHGSIAAGAPYRLEVRQGNEVLHQETVWANSAAMGLTVTLPEPKQESPVSTETISIARLLHAPSAKAKRLFDKAMETADLAESIELLQKAVDEHAAYIEAHHNLAVRLTRAGQFDQAVQHFKQVLDLDPSNAMTWANLGVTLEAMGDDAAAETAAKQALVFEPRSPTANYLLGTLLLRQEKSLTQAAELLGNAADEFPVAGLLQIDALLAAGETAPARRALHSLVAAANGVH